MRFYQEQHRHTCGIDLHGRNLYLHVLDEQGDIRLHRKLRCDPELFLRTIAPYRDDLVVGAECNSLSDSAPHPSPEKTGLYGEPAHLE